MTDSPPPAGWYPQGEHQRYWDGTQWTEYTAPLVPMLEPDQISAIRQQALAVAIAQQQARGAVVADRGEDWAIVTGVLPAERVSHILHLILSVLTCGAWILVWLIVAATAKGPRDYALRIEVTPAGQARTVPLKQITGS